MVLHQHPFPSGSGKELKGQFLSMCLPTAWLPRISLKTAHSLTIVPKAVLDSARIHPSLAIFLTLVALSTSVLLAAQTSCLLVPLGLEHAPDGNNPLGCCHVEQTTLKRGKSMHLLSHVA